MKNWIEILSKETTAFRYRALDDFYILSPNFFFLDSNDGIAVRIDEDEEGRPIFCDCHTTLDYLEDVREVDVYDYADKLNKIVKRYRLDFNKTERTFSLKVPTDQPDYFVKYLGYFLQALSLLANIDV